MPDGSCHSAMVSTVRDRSVALRRPGSSSDGIGDVLCRVERGGGAQPRDEDGAGKMPRLVRIYDDAFADERIEDAVDELHGARLLLDLPAQHAVIRVDETVGLDGLTQTHCAPQPPVR